MAGELEIVANADSIDNVWLLDPQNRKMKQVTAVVGGIAETVSASDSRWILLDEHKGYDLAKVAAFNGSTRELQSGKVSSARISRD